MSTACWEDFAFILAIILSYIKSVYFWYRRYPWEIKKMVPKVILEGTRLTRKTDLAFVWMSNPDSRPRKFSIIHLYSAEWWAFTMSLGKRADQLCTFREPWQWKRMQPGFIFWLQRYYSGSLIDSYIHPDVPANLSRKILWFSWLNNDVTSWFQMNFWPEPRILRASQGRAPESVWESIPINDFRIHYESEQLKILDI